MIHSSLKRLLTLALALMAALPAAASGATTDSAPADLPPQVTCDVLARCLVKEPLCILNSNAPSIYYLLNEDVTCFGGGMDRPVSYRRTVEKTIQLDYRSPEATQADCDFEKQKARYFYSGC